MFDEHYGFSIPPKRAFVPVLCLYPRVLSISELYFCVLCGSTLFVVLRYLSFCAICKLALPVVLPLASLTYNDCKTNQDKDRLVRYGVLTRLSIAS